MSLLLLAGLAAAQTLDEGFEDVTQVLEVEVPINVLDPQGHPVRDLAADDFAIFDNGEPQQITGFRVIDLELVQPGPTRTEIEAAIPATGRRHVLLLFDLTFSAPTTLI
ncbi:MAG: hypothetical protein ACRD0X_02740, partial [Thermoanaerobaculia bacterium]